MFLIIYASVFWMVFYKWSTYALRYGSSGQFFNKTFKAGKLISFNPIAAWVTVLKPVRPSGILPCLIPSYTFFRWSYKSVEIAYSLYFRYTSLFAIFNNACSSTNIPFVVVLVPARKASKLPEKTFPVPPTPFSSMIVL